MFSFSENNDNTFLITLAGCGNHSVIDLWLTKNILDFTIKNVSISDNGCGYYEIIVSDINDVFKIKAEFSK